MLGSFLPYQNVKPLGACFECGKCDGHFALECPIRFARVIGDVPPGLRIDGPGRASKNPADWTPNLSELTDEAWAQYQTYITRFPIAPA